MPLPEPTIAFDPLVADQPMMDDRAFGAFCKDILAVGRFHEPARTLNGKILDGRHRHLASLATGIPLKLKPFVAERDGDPWDFVLSQIAARRERTESIKVVESVLLAERCPRAKRGSGKVLESIAERTNLSLTYLKAARACRNADPTLWRQLASGKVKITEVINRRKHATAKTRVEAQRVAANVTLDDLDLRLGDNVELMRAMPDGKFRCIFADPPYNQGWAYRADPHADRRASDVYMAEMEAWITQAARLLTHDGSLFVVINDEWSDHFGMLLRNAGLIHQPTIVWVETFSQYNSREDGPTPCVRPIHYYTKTDAPFFNNVELRDETGRERGNDSRKSGVGKVPDNVWFIPRVNGNALEKSPYRAKGDAPQLPRLVPERCILMATEVGDTVLDPFNGQGVSGVAAIHNHRKYVGLDHDEQGLAQARAWIPDELARLAALLKKESK